MVFVKILVWIAVLGGAILIMKYKERVVRMVGKNEMAERYLGPGGTYTFWVLFAILLIVIATVWLVG
ncbi:TPA: hypothetical protein DD449_05370 [Candidatus Berkelbacteria bacterium]|uniref:Uncharacterized protein n=1 Tax=Berkelbacteria bacterium GW2011_GWE1_39_12 TaxID=1618337 RepID=A0A0G4B290_9BACT|nr:MAG: hypothetical protein UT28_C0001G0146 [Berkelbacteria bacterium GW2011_GWE1_39_12]HBO61074.1 hypothetical protein [Candidatus Berkelbacteria bacterium]